MSQAWDQICHIEIFSIKRNTTHSMKAIFSLFVITNENGTPSKTEIEEFY